MDNVRVAVVGGGAAGLAAAVVAAERGAEVTLFEVKPRIGSSILATGNGRCNISNSQVSAADYHNPDFVAEAFSCCGPERVWAFFNRLGLIMREEAQGRLYPATNKATSVLDVLRFAADEAGVTVETESEVVGVKPAGNQQLVRFANGTMAFFDRTILAVGGGVAHSMLPAAYPFAPQRKVLCGLKTQTDSIKGLDNVRVRGRVTLLDGKTGEARIAEEEETRQTKEVQEGEARQVKEVQEGEARQVKEVQEGEARQVKAAEEGEIQFRTYGVSGVAVFNVSRFAKRGDVLSLDLLPELSLDQLEAELARRAAAHPHRDRVELLAGMLLPAVARCVLHQSGIKRGEALGQSQVQRLASTIHSFKLQITGFKEELSQVRRGGFAVESFDPATMESRLHAHVYLTGEALDVDGPCGGYNLHWAWTSGMLAGAAATADLAAANGAQAGEAAAANKAQAGEAIAANKAQAAPCAKVRPRFATGERKDA